MKRAIIILSILLFSLSFASAKCDLNVSLINQDPYPAVPGDYVKLVFQITGTENPDCAHVSVELLEKYPISFDPGESSLVQIKGGTFQKDYSSYLMVPYKVRLDSNALDGENPIEVRYGSGQNLTQYYTSKLFNIEVQDTHADFELFVKDYNPITKILTFEILNIASSDVKAISLEIPKQKNIQIMGARTNIIGDLDSNEYTTADFNAKAEKGSITVKISYSDSINHRRTLEKTVAFDPSYFKSDENQKISGYLYWVFALVVLAIIYYLYKKRKKKKEKTHRRKGSAKLV